jgi:hypothetical protein
MCISNKEQLSKTIKKLDEEKRAQKDLIVNHFRFIQQSVDPVFLLNKRLAKSKKRVPDLVDNFIDQSFFSATDVVRNKIGLNRGSFVTNAADNFLQKTFSRFFINNRFKIKAVVLAIAKNLF